MPFVKGQSGNPGGRPKALRAVEAVAREHSELAIRTLAEIAGNSEAPPAARVAASSAILDRGWGRPKQVNEHSGPDGEPVPVSVTVQFVKL